MSEMKLPADFSRCHDSSCPAAYKCARYKRRFDPGHYMVHTTSLRDSDGGCDHFIYNISLIKNEDNANASEKSV